MPGERRKQRVRHEAGGSTEVADSTPTAGSTQQQKTSAATVAAAAAAKPVTEGSRGGDGGRGRGGDGGRGRGGDGGRGRGDRGRGGGGGGDNRGKRGGRRGASVATVDESQFYQPVTIMQSKGKDGETVEAPDELDDVPCQYKRRGIVSNWSRYDEMPPALEELEDGRDYLIGEDFAAILQQQSQGSGGGGHLQLRGEEDWGPVQPGGGSQHCLGSVRVADLASTIATLPLMGQLAMADCRLPKQLSEYYSQLADDNRRLYDPSEDKTVVADTAEIIEQQMHNLRLSFFDDVSSSSSAQEKHHPTPAKTSQNITKNAVITNGDDKGNDEKLYDFDRLDPFAGSDDFSLLDDDDVVVNDNEAVKVDLTEKMCQAFGSNINDIGDDFGGLVIEDATEVVCSQSPSELNVANSLSNTFGNISESHPKTQTNLDVSRTSKETNPSSSKTKSREVNSQESIHDHPKPGLDFSSGNETFNFGLPRLDPVSDNTSIPTIGNFGLPRLDPVSNNTSIPTIRNIIDASHKGNKSSKEELLDVFTPKLDEKKVPEVDDHPLVDLNAPIIPQPVAVVSTKQDNKELEDWLDSVLDD